jgi:hypothetical protein
MHHIIKRNLVPFLVLSVCTFALKDHAQLINAPNSKKPKLKDPKHPPGTSPRRLQCFIDMKVTSAIKFIELTPKTRETLQERRQEESLREPQEHLQSQTPGYTAESMMSS